MAGRGWSLLLVDLKAKVSELAHDVVHGVAPTMEVLAEQNFWRGKISAFEEIIELADELQQWRTK